jgi:hypothetical protein
MWVACLFLPSQFRRDRPGADVHLAAQRRVADVGEVLGLRALPEPALLHLDEVADRGLPLEHGRPAQMRERPDLAVPADHHPGPDHAERVDDGALADLDVRVDERRGGIHDLDAGGHELLEDPVAQHAPRPGQLREAVHAPDLLRVGRLDRLHAHPVGEEQPRHVRQVVLAGAVLVPDARQGPEQRAAPEQVDPGVHLVDGPLGGGAVLPLPDRLDAALRIPEDAPVAPGIVRPERQHRGRGLRAAVAIAELPERGRRDERNVAAQHEDVAVPTLEERRRLEDGVPRPVLLDLLHEADVLAVELRAHALRLVTDHDDDAIGLQGARRLEHVAEEGPPADRLQDLRTGCPHADTFPGRQDDDVERSARAHCDPEDTPVAPPTRVRPPLSGRKRARIARDRRDREAIQGQAARPARPGQEAARKRSRRACAAACRAPARSSPGPAS